MTKAYETEEAIMGAIAFARRRTVDGFSVSFYDDDTVTVALDRLTERTLARRLDRDLAFVLADEVCLYTASELSRLIRDGRKAYAKWCALWERDARMGSNRDVLRVLVRVAQASRRS